MSDKLTILGSGTCVSSLYKPFDFRHESAYLLEFQGKNILIDSSQGVRERLEHIKFDYWDIDFIFISHFHPDHFDLDGLLQSFFVRGLRGGKKKKLVVFGPKGIEKNLSIEWDMKHTPADYQNKFKPAMDISFVEYRNNEVIVLDKNLKITPYSVTHLGLDAYALKFDLAGIDIAYSGDTGICPGVNQVAQKADIFICEANINIGEENKNRLQHHLSAYQAGIITKSAKVKQLILTHLSGKDAEAELIKEVKKTGYNEKINVACDFAEYKLD